MKVIKMLNPNIEYRSDRKFTTGTIGDFFRIRLNKKNLALANLLARMQMNATASFPSISQQQEVLSKFYDMSFEVVPQIMGPEIIMSYVTNFVEPVEVLDPEYTYKNIYKTFEKMAHHPLINEEILELSKKQLEDEYREVMEEPSSYALDKFFKIWYQDRPDYEDTFMGDINLIKDLTLKEVLTFSRSIRIAPGAKLGVMKSANSIEMMVRKNNNLDFAGIIRAFDMDEIVNIPAGPQEGIYEEENHGNLQAQVYLGYGYREGRDEKFIHVKDIETEYRKRLVGLILSEYLAGDQSSKLFTSIREELGAAYQVSANSYHRNSLFLINTGIDPDQIDEVIKIIKDEVEKVKRGDIDLDLLKKSKKSLINFRLIAQDRENWQLANLLRQEMFRGYGRIDDDYMDIITDINPKMLADFANDLFLKESYVLK